MKVQTNSVLDTRDFDYDLPQELIAQHPVEHRDHSRLMCIDRQTGVVKHHLFYELPQLLRGPSLLVVNNTRVFPARLLGSRQNGGQVELLLVRRLETKDGVELWSCLGKPRRKLKPGTQLDFADIHGIVKSVDEEQLYVELRCSIGVMKGISKYGHIPLPPYIKREDEGADHDRYQTMFAGKEKGSVAAPTAGLHFTEDVVNRLLQTGHRLTSVTLHVGPGTFRPIRSEKITDHKMDEEWFEISEKAARAIGDAQKEGRQIIAVGTTVVRTLESAKRKNGLIIAQKGMTDLFIYAEEQFKVVDGLLTNFHLPKSTLLALVCAFAGQEKILAAYRKAVGQQYRFYSYGDATLIQN